MHLQTLAITINQSLIGHDRYYEAGFVAPHPPTKARRTRFSQGLEQARPNRKLSQGAENFQELKICGHGTVLVLYVFLKGLKELR